MGMLNQKILKLKSPKMQFPAFRGLNWYNWVHSRKCSVHLSFDLLATQSTSTSNEQMMIIKWCSFAREQILCKSVKKGTCENWLNYSIRGGLRENADFIMYYLLTMFLKVVASSLGNKKVGDFSEQSSRCALSVVGAYWNPWETLQRHIPIQAK